MLFCIRFLTLFVVLWSVRHCTVLFAGEMSLFEIKTMFAMEAMKACWILMSRFMLNIQDSYSNLLCEPDTLGVMLLSQLCCGAVCPSQILLPSLFPSWPVFWDPYKRKEWEAEIVQENKSPSNNSFRHFSHFNWINCTENPVSVVYNSPGALSYHIHSCLYSN